MEIRYSMRPVRQSDNNAGSHILQHEDKGVVADKEDD